MIKNVVISFITGLVLSTMVTGLCEVQAVPTQANDIRLFLQGYLKSYDVPRTRYSIAPISLEDNGLEYIVYLFSQDWCGTGGCSALILKKNGSSYKVIQNLTLVRLPIIILNTTTNGWHDIAMPVAGGGVINKHIDVMIFDGEKYRPSSRVLQNKITPDIGIILPLDEKGSLLYEKIKTSS